MKLRRTTKLEKQVKKANKLLVFVGIFSVSLLSIGIAFAANQQFSINLVNPEETTISAAGYFVSMFNSQEVNLEILPSPVGKEGSAAQEIRVHTNAPTGYRLYLSSGQATDYAANKPGNALYRNGDQTLEHIDPTTGTYNIDSASASLTALTANTWGFTMTDPTNGGSTSNGTYGKVPLSGDKVLVKQTSVADTSADSPNTKFNIYYGAKVSTSIPSGVYTGNVIYSLMADAGNAQEAAISPNKTNSLTTTTPVTITTSLFTNVEDLGTITAYIGTNGNAADACSNLTYNTDEALLVVSCEAPTRDLDVTTSYNVYVNVPKYDKVYTITNGFTYEDDNKFWTITNMQEMTPDICAWATTPSTSATTSDTTGAYKGNKSYVAQRTLSDIRDSSTYTVRKLADGNCWMTQNLRLRLTAGQALTSDNTDLNSRTSWTPTVTTQTTTGTKWGSNGSAGTTGEINDQYAAVEHSYWDNLQLTTLDSDTQYRGSYYNWYTATAMSGTWNMGANGAENAPDSICPKGWQLPTNSGDKSFQNLTVTVYQLLTTPGDGNSAARDKLMKNPFSYTYSGRYYWPDGSIYSGSNAYFWSSEAYATTRARLLGFYSNGRVYPQGEGDKPDGFSVRCVSR